MKDKKLNQENNKAIGKMTIEFTGDAKSLEIGRLLTMLSVMDGASYKLEIEGWDKTWGKRNELSWQETKTENG